MNTSTLNYGLSNSNKHNMLDESSKFNSHMNGDFVCRVCKLSGRHEGRSAHEKPSSSTANVPPACGCSTSRALQQEKSLRAREVSTI
eukprot:scaffold4715_cov22-Tisochrysis_lutea.AAC.2